MKFLLLALSLSFTQAAFSMDESLKFEDCIEVNQVVMLDEILINDLIKIYNDLDTENNRMIAGEFENKEKKSATKAM